ncbi:Insulin-degrading enzyme [Hypsibius exemplaris]|uniref:Insulin-degrading enzyme n=1 Tax=Hypsibius exemplaris TaxID=2072580 RepID=A0A1W0XE31_HYPEX|nr:Insulin-degrading enzyme [Hypsibius exemplaris]
MWFSLAAACHMHKSCTVNQNRSPRTQQSRSSVPKPKVRLGPEAEEGVCPNCEGNISTNLTYESGQHAANMNVYHDRDDCHGCCSIDPPGVQDVINSCPNCNFVFGRSDVVDHFPKPLQDQRLYRGLVLENDLKVLLISDPKTEKAAAALDVNIGCMSDPWKLQGLAHFLEHMLFLGTEKYPEENAFEKYVSERGGEYNAFTAEENTNFHFNVAAEFLATSLDRFAQFFISPLLTESGTEREVNAVNSEHENNLSNDGSRIDQLNRSTGDEKHDFNKFGTGSKETLWFKPRREGISVRDELKKFHDTYYSSNIMCLAVLGTETLDELGEMVLGLFNDVPNKKVTPPDWTGNFPFKAQHLEKQLHVVPVADIRQLSVVWNIHDLHPFYKTRPGHHLGGLIGHEGPGSLLSALKSKGWSSSLYSGDTAGAKGFQFFTVGVSLTEDGLAHVNDIVTMIFQYLNLLRKSGPQERIWHEEQQIEDMKFRFRDTEKPLEYCQGLAMMMQKYPMSEVLSASTLLTKYDAKAISDLLDLLTPEGIRISILSKTFAKASNNKEPIYGTEYELKDIPKELIAMWSKAGLNGELALPPPNAFIPQKFDILQPPSKVQQFPVLIRKTDFARLWYLQDVEHRLPKACALFELCSPIVYKNPTYAVMAHLFVELFRDALNELVYIAALTDMNYSLEQSQYGFVLSVSGYDDKLDVLLDMLIGRLVNFKPDEKRFHIIKEEAGRQLKNFFASEPSKQSMWYFNVIMSEICFPKEDLIEALDTLSYEKFTGLVPEVFSKIYVEGFIYGNTSRKKADFLLDEVEVALRRAGSHPIAPVNRSRLVNLLNGSDLVYHRLNDIHKSSSVTTYYQCASENPKTNMLLELFAQITGEPCFDVLRTKEQLGYVVFSSVKNVSGVLGLQVLVQSHRTPEYVDQRIENFIREMQPFVSQLSAEEFKTHVEALAAHRLEKPKTIAQQATKYWNEIFSRQYNFDRDRLEVAELRNLTQVDLNQFISDYLLAGGANRKKCTIHITSTVPANAPSRHRRAIGSEEGDGDSSEGDFSDEEDAVPPVDPVTPDPIPAIGGGSKCEPISDIELFKKRMGFHPLPPVYSDINTVFAE